MKRPRRCRRARAYEAPAHALFSRFPDDELLRQNGFRIFSRTGDAATWIFAGRLFSQVEALDFVGAAAKEAQAQ